jgi:hypothetical protein
MSNCDYLSVDIEGCKHVGDDFRQIGACDVRDRTNTFFVEFYRVPDWNHPNEIILVSDQEEGVRKFAEWCNKFHRPVFVSFNAYDWIHIYAAFDRYGIPNPFGQPGRTFEIKAYFGGLMKKDQNETNKRDVTKIFPSIQKHTHNGLEDAIEQAEIFEQMLDFRWDQRETTIELEECPCGSGERVPSYECCHGKIRDNCPQCDM